MKTERVKALPLKELLVLAGLFVGMFFVIWKLDITPEMVLNYTPQNPFLAAGVLLLLHVVKCTTIFFPLIVLQIVAGHLLPAWAAILVNLLGIQICLTLPYWIGHFVGIGTIRKLTDRYPKFQTVLEHQQENSLFLCFFLRITSVLPGDIVTLYFGATHVPFRYNLIGGTLGILPGMTLATLNGSSIRDPSSPMFWVSVTLSFLLSTGSALGYYIYRRHIHKTKKLR